MLICVRFVIKHTSNATLLQVISDIFMSVIGYRKNSISERLIILFLPERVHLVRNQESFANDMLLRSLICSEIELITSKF